MLIDTLCPKCGCVIYAPEETADGEVLCPGCAAVVRVADSARFWSQRQEPIALACPACKAPIRVVARLVGLRVRCNTCQAVLLVSLSLTEAGETDDSRPGVILGRPDRRGDEPQTDPSRQAVPPPLPAGIRQLRPRAGPFERRSDGDGIDRELSVLNRLGSVRKRRQAAHVAPWFWPSVVALAATLAMLLALAVIRSAA